MQNPLQIASFCTTSVTMASFLVCRLTTASFSYKVPGVFKGVCFSKIHPILCLAIEQFSVDWSNRTVGPKKSEL